MRKKIITWNEKNIAKFKNKYKEYVEWCIEYMGRSKRIHKAELDKEKGLLEGEKIGLTQ